MMKYYRTDSLALCPYIAMNELKYVGTEVDDQGKVVFIFEDPQELGTELAMSFARSREREYKNLWSHFRNEVDIAKRKAVPYERLMKGPKS